MIGFYLFYEFKYSESDRWEAAKAFTINRAELDRAIAWYKQNRYRFRLRYVVRCREK